MTSPGLEGRIADLEKAMRSLMATNWTDRASVVNAAGRAVPLSAVAFGQVIVEDPRASVSINGALNSTGGGWTDQGGPYLDVYVSGGSLRVDVGAEIVAFGMSPFAAMSYQLRGPGAQQADAASAPLIADANIRRCVALGDSGATAAVNKTAASSGFGLHTGLTAGWYRVSAVYTLSYASSSTVQSTGTFYGSTLAATPL